MSEKLVEKIVERFEKVSEVIKQLKIRQSNSSDSLTQDYGFLKFDNSTFDATTTNLPPQYIRLSLETMPATVVQFMLQGWGLQQPDLIISITGGAKRFDMSPGLKRSFQSGLISVAVETNAWLITAGTNTGVVREVGEALRVYRFKSRQQIFNIPCIGMGSWGYTAGKDQLENQSNKSSAETDNRRRAYSFRRSHQNASDHNIPMENDNRIVVRKYDVKNVPHGYCDLEPNHTHFLLFDDGLKSADSVLSIRAEIENCAKNFKQQNRLDESEESPIPIVLVLVEGGSSSIATVLQALKSNIPVVVIKDSGRAADYIAELYEFYSDSQINRRQSPSDDSRRKQLDKILNKAKAKITKFQDIGDDHQQIIKEHQDLIAIFKFDMENKSGGFESAILESLFSAARLSYKTREQKIDSKQTKLISQQKLLIRQLKLAIAWNNIGYAKQYLTDIAKYKATTDDLRTVLVDALRRGHVDFVVLLIDFGVPFEILTENDVQQLYTTTRSSNRLPLPDAKHGEESLKDRYYSSYLHSIIENANQRKTLSQSNVEMQLGINATQSLFLWSVFLGKHELDIYLCSKTWNTFKASLVGAGIYRKAAKLTSDLSQKTQYIEYAEEFDNHAASVIDLCFDNDENVAADLLKCQSTLENQTSATFCDVDPIELAQKANCRSFLASKSVQRYLDDKWYGRINYNRKAVNFRIFFYSLFFPLLPIFCFGLSYNESPATDNLGNLDNVKVSDLKPKQNNLKKTISWFKKIVYFYDAPIVRFYYYTIFFIIFLALFSFVLLVDYFPLNIYGEIRSGFDSLLIPITEIILHICAWSLIAQELHELIFTRSKIMYLSDIWNMVDILAIILYVIGFATRFFVREIPFMISKIFLCVDLIIWFVRTLHLFAAFEKLGPKLIMIYNTMKDLLFFVCFILIFLFGFSIASWALLTTDDQVYWNYFDNGSLSNVTVVKRGSGLWSWKVLRELGDYGVWKIFGQVDILENMDAYSNVVFALNIIFVTIANILLLNVLVALFNVSIQNVEQQSHRIWRYQRYLLVNEYSKKPLLPPPFNTLYYLYRGIRYLLKEIARLKYTSVDAASGTELRQVNSDDREFSINDTTRRESAIASDYWNDILKQKRKDHSKIG